MDFDIPVPRVTRRPKRPRKILRESKTIDNNLSTLDTLIGSNNITSNINSNGSYENSTSMSFVTNINASLSSNISSISQYSITAPSDTVVGVGATRPTVFNNNINASTTRTNLVSSPNDKNSMIPNFADTKNVTNSSSNHIALSSTTAIATAASAETRSSPPTFQEQRRSANKAKRPLCVGDFIKGLRDGEPTQSVREREASRKRRRGKGKNNNLDKNKNLIHRRAVINELPSNTGSISNNSNNEPTQLSTSEKRKNEKDDDSSNIVNSSSSSSTLSASTSSSFPTLSENRNNSPPRNIVPTVHMVDGNIVINQASMVYVPEANTTQLEQSNISEEAQNRVTSASYSRRTPAMRWSVKDTGKFYDLLRQFGTNFSMIEEYFPRRTRRQIKNKFVKEEISNRKLINWAIIARTGMGLNQFNEYLEKKYSNNKLGIDTSY
jgi:hypothetical protein